LPLPSEEPAFWHTLHLPHGSYPSPTRIKLPDLTNSNAGQPIKFEFQINYD
jgi:hypothetical protein